LGPGLRPGLRIRWSGVNRAIETNNDELLASARIGAVADRAVLHRPDLAIVCPGGQVVPIEVELSIKSASRLAAICRGYNRARHISHVYYLATPGPANAVKRAARTVHATTRVRVLALQEIPRLVHELTIDSEPTATSVHAYPPEQRCLRQHQTPEILR